MLNDLYKIFNNILNNIIPKNKLVKNILIVVIITLLLTGICWNLGYFIIIMVIIAVICSITTYCNLFSITSITKYTRYFTENDILQNIISFIKSQLS